MARERVTVRVLLLDGQDRILLMRGRLASDRPAVWFPIGGGVEPGEDLASAAAREIAEETGFSGCEIGPVVWLREGVLELHGEARLFRESYVVARCAGGEPSREGWQALERELSEDIRWWTRAALLRTREAVVPPGLGERLKDILAGRLPSQPAAIPWT